MSIVGPRPEIKRYIDKYDEDKKKYYLSNRVLLIMPQLNLKRQHLLYNSNNAEFIYVNKILPIKINLSRKYVKERSFFGDIVIILKHFISY